MKQSVKRCFVRLTNFAARRPSDVRPDERVNAEIENHVVPQAEANLPAGVSPERARREASLKFGAVESIKKDQRRKRGMPFVDSLIQDLHYGLRMLRKSPDFTAVAILTLALGIGANTAIFSFVYGVLLAPLPYRDASQLVVLNETTPTIGTVSVSYLNFVDWQTQSRSLSGMAYVEQMSFNLAGANVSPPENIHGDAVSPNFLSMMGVHPFLGRDFQPTEGNSGTQRVLLLSNQLWQSHFGADPNVIGRSIALDGNDFVIVGVLPPSYRSLDKTVVMLPIGLWTTNNEIASTRGDRGDSSVASVDSLKGVRSRRPGPKWKESPHVWPGSIPKRMSSSACSCARFVTLSPATCERKFLCSLLR